MIHLKIIIDFEFNSLYELPVKVDGFVLGMEISLGIIYKFLSLCCLIKFQNWLNVCTVYKQD